MAGDGRRVVGLDIGGSKTHALVAGPVVDAAPQQEVLAGSANLSSVGEAGVTAALSAVFDEIGRDGVVAVCAGAAGVDSPAQEQRLHRLVQAQVPGATVSIVHDAHLILAAAGAPHGVAVISGTGSVAWGRTPKGRTARAGGWGYLLGDEGSGYWLAVQAVRHALLLVDRGEVPDDLSRHLTAACGLQQPAELLDHFYATPERRYWAGHARLVFDLAVDGDQLSRRMISEAALALVEVVSEVGAALQLTGPVVLAGGQLVHQSLLRDAVRDGLAGRGFGDIRLLERDPVHGALLLARRSAVPGAVD